jgi:hypothetical protein
MAETDLITLPRATVHQALEVLEALQGGCTDHNDGTVEAITVWCPEVIDALKAALEQPEQCMAHGECFGGQCIYTSQSGQPEQNTDCHAQGICQRSGYGIGRPDQKLVAYACFKNGELQTELVGTEADVDFWCASDEPEMQGMVKGALYTHPPREWRGLTEEEIEAEWVCTPQEAKAEGIYFGRRIEAALKEKNHD